MRSRDTDKPSIDIIKPIYVPHCARGPKRCTRCKEAMKEKKLCHIKLYTKAGNVTRPVMEYKINDEKGFFEYDVIKIFSTTEEAREYAKDNRITDFSTDSS